MKRSAKHGWMALIAGLLVAVGGTSLAGDHAPAVEGQWSGTLPFDNIAGIHSTMLPTGKVFFWQTRTDTGRLWDPVTGEISDVATPQYLIFCAGHTLLPDGRLLVLGGHAANYFGYPNADIYDPFTNTWANSDDDPSNDVPDMNDRRWYPSATVLGNGDVLVMSGSINGRGTNNQLPQVYETATNTWRDLTTAVKELPNYPRTFLAPDGRVISLSNRGDTTDIIDVTGTGSWSFVDNTLDPRLFDYGPAVMYDAGKIAYIGGGPGPTANISLLDLNDENPQWTYAADTMAQPRRQNDATILADGTVLITGGTFEPGWNENIGLIATAEIWDPVTGLVTQMSDADPDVYRGYHSTATLLPDGRVMVTGGDGGEHGRARNSEIYSPPYLFKGARPSVTSAPSEVGHGETFFVDTPDAASIADALWIVPGSTTHSQNWSQRADHLEFIEVDGGLEITVPSNPNEAPPGYYMLFLINDNGVPSIAEWLNVRAAVIESLLSDLTGDGYVDFNDLTILLANWDTELGAGRGNLIDPLGSRIDFQDLTRLLADWTGPGPNAPMEAALGEEAVPEPSSCMLALLAMLAMGVGRRRKRPAA